MVCKMLEGLRWARSSKDMRLPITSELLNKIIDKLPSGCFSLPQLFHGFLRVGEIVYTELGQLQQIVSLNDAQILCEGKDQFIRLRLQHSKCDHAGKGTFIDIAKTDTPVCPVKLLKDYLAIRSKLNGLLFCHFNGKHVSRYQFSSILSKSLKVLGIDSSGFKSHSFRIGAATEAAAKGISNEEIMKLGRWKSEAYKSYIRF